MPLHQLPLHTGGRKMARAWWLPAIAQYTRTTKATTNTAAARKWMSRTLPKKYVNVASRDGPLHGDPIR